MEEHYLYMLGHSAVRAELDLTVRAAASGRSSSAGQSDPGRCVPGPPAAGGPPV